MRNSGFADKLNQEIDELLAGGRPATDTTPGSLLRLAQELTRLPRPAFKHWLKQDLVGETTADRFESRDLREIRIAEILPSLGTMPWRVFPADHRSFLLSFASHFALVLLIASGIWVGARPGSKQSAPSAQLIFSLPGSGGGGSGDHSRLPASQGGRPQFSHQPLAPPLVVVENRRPQLAVPPAVLAPPEIRLPAAQPPGDLMAASPMPSNGTGAGDGAGNGLGPGEGAGAGPGFERGFGGKIFTPGLGIEPPRAIYQPDPEYSEEARKTRMQGTVLVALVVDRQGHPRNVRVLRSLGLGLDDKAVEAVRKWRFEPGKKDGQNVAVQVNVEIQFRLY